MSGVTHSKTEQHLTERLSTSGFRFTLQRQHVYDVILNKRDHPTAEEVFIRTKKTMPEISHATVYNCLDALAKCGLIRQVQLERGATRFCPNMEEHCHYFCDACGEVFDVALPTDSTVMPRRKVFKWIIMTSPFTAVARNVRKKNDGPWFNNFNV
ncbi:MAG: transcriptional repressor [Limisphaerales bacterium]